MERKYIIISFSLVVLLLVFGSVYFTTGNNTNQSNSVDTPKDNVSLNLIVNVIEDKSITLAELGKHNSMEDCWVGFKGKAYDLTSWLPKHPGSAGAILPSCGTAKEFEDAFVKKHGQTKVNFFMKVAILMGDLKLQGNLNA